MNAGIRNVTQKRYKEMIKTKKYRTLLSLLTGNKKCDKDHLRIPAFIKLKS